MLVKSNIKRVFAYLTIFIMLLGIFIPQNVPEASAASKYGTVTLRNSGTQIRYGTHGTFILSVRDTNLNDGAGGDNVEAEKTLFCIQPSKETPPSGTYPITKIYDGDDTTIGKMMYAAPGQPGYAKAKAAGWYGNYDSYNNHYVLCHILFSWWNDGLDDSTDAFKGTSSAMISQVKRMKNNLSDLDEPPSNYFVYYLTSSSHYQNIIGAYEKELGKIKIRKKSSDTSVTNNNSDYSRGDMYFAVINSSGKTVLSSYDENPQYINGTLYTASTKDAGEISTIAHGDTMWIWLEPGTYTIKEVYVDPTSGFKHNTSTKKVTVASGDAKIVEFTNEPYTGQLEVYKSPDDTKWENESPSKYTLANATYGLYKSEAAAKTAKKADAFMTATTTSADGKGKATFKKIPYGTYYLAEISPSEGYAVDKALPKKIIVNRPSTDPYVINSEEPGKNGSITLIKTSKNGEYTYDNPFYKETECEYTLYKKDGTLVAKKAVTKASDGTFKCSWTNVPLGEYYVKETKAGTGYYLDEKEYPVTIETDGQRTTVAMEGKTVKSTEPYETVDVKIVKKSSNEEVSCDNPNYSLKGAKFTVKNTTINKTWTLETDEDGLAVKEDLPLGEYTVTEIAPPPGFNKELTDPVQTRTLPTGTVETTFTFDNEPFSDPAQVLLYKADSETGKYLNAEELKEYYPQKGGSLAGAVFEVNFYAITEEEQPADKDYSRLTPARTWYIQTDENGYATIRENYLADGYDSDEFYKDEFGDYVFPIGTVTMQEIVAPQGYNINDELFVERVEQGAIDIVHTYQEPVIEDDIKRGDVEFQKINPAYHRLAGIPFVLTMLEEDGKEVEDESLAEKHIIVTDENGEFKSVSS